MAEVTAVAPFFGSNRMLGKHVGAALKGCEWVGVVFAGGMAEVPHIGARTINVNDIHRHVINLGRVMAHPMRGPALYRRLRRFEMHPDVLAYAQEFCSGFDVALCDDSDDLVKWAEQYFVCAWMTRHGSAGTPAEFTSGISTRWNAGGGDSAAHFQGAVRAINALRRTLRRCNFTTLDFRAFLAKCKDLPRHGIYADAPWPDDGERYSHGFTIQDHRDLAALLVSYQSARVVVRFGDHPLIRELYPETTWDWRPFGGRTQANKAKSEFLIVRNCEST